MSGPIKLRRHSRIDELRRSIDTLPRHTRLAMLEGIRANEIIVGAYADRVGGVCPMLAAHRNGGRTDADSFAKAWDGFTRATKARKASPHEVRMLESQLEASLLEGVAEELDAAVAEHQALARERRAREAKATGWRWLRRSRIDEPDADDAETRVLSVR